MNSIRHLLVALLSSLLFLASPVAAQDDGDEPAEEDPEPEVADEGPNVWDRVLSFGVTGGFDTPLGVAGGVIEFAPVPYFAIYAGGGVSRAGGIFGGGIRGQVPMGNAAIGLMAGVSAGPHEWHSLGGDNTQIRRYWAFGLFLHSGLTFEYRWDMGLFFRLAFGVDGYMTPEEPDECTFSDGSDCGVFAEGLGKPLRPWAGLTLGYALDL